MQALALMTARVEMVPVAHTLNCLSDTLSPIHIVV